MCLLKFLVTSPERQIKTQFSPQFLPKGSQLSFNILLNVAPICLRTTFMKGKQFLLYFHKHLPKFNIPHQGGRSYVKARRAFAEKFGLGRKF